MSAEPLTPVSATGLLAEHARAGVLALADVHVAKMVGRRLGEHRDEVLLACALTVRALARGSICIDLETVSADVRGDLLDPALFDDNDPGDVARRASLDALRWPEAAAWLAALHSSPLVGTRAYQPLRLHGSQLYLTRYWNDEQTVLDALAAREVAEPPPTDDEVVVERTLDRLFGPGPDRQRDAAAVAARSWTLVLAGGPGTGKTTTVARVLALLQSQSDRPLRVALAAPTGKAAHRLGTAVREQASAVAREAPELRQPEIPVPVTVHKLLGSRGPGKGFSHGAGNLLPHDVVVLDEMSMVALPLFARALSAVRPDTRLILVGDPHQLSSVDAGQVMADLAATALTIGGGRADPAVIELHVNHRFSGALSEIAGAIRNGDADRVVELFTSGDPAATMTTLDRPQLALSAVPDLSELVVQQGRAVVRASRAGDPGAALTALDGHRLLCAHRAGPWGVARWGGQVLQVLRASIDGYADAAEWYAGRPVIASVNDRELGVSNGDSGVVLRLPDGTPAIAFGDRWSHRTVPPWLVQGVTSLYATTIHKAQGSQFDRVTVVLPPVGSPLLTRELLYTAVTRAMHSVLLISSEDALRAAIGTVSRRTSGLAERWTTRASSPRADATDPAPF